MYEIGIPKTLYISDLQCGDRLALCPDYLGGNELQHKLWLNYIECLDTFAEWCGGERFFIIFGAELVQGDWERFDAERMPKQWKILVQSLEQIQKHVSDEQITKSFLLTGNEVHTGKLNAYQEVLEFFRIADDFRMVKDDLGRLSRPELEIEYPNGCVLHATHFFNFTNIYPLTAYEREWKEIGCDYLETGETPPDVYYRAHVHRGHVHRYTKHPRSNVKVFTTPGWQLKGEYPRKGLARLKRTEYGLAWSDIVNGKFDVILLKGTVTNGRREIA